MLLIRDCISGQCVSVFQVALEYLGEERILLRYSAEPSTSTFRFHLDQVGELSFHLQTNTLVCILEQDHAFLNVVVLYKSAS